MKNALKGILGPVILIALLVAARYIFPNKIAFMINLMIFTIYVMGNNILYGYLGMVSFGQPFYMGVGAYCTAIYIAYLGVNPLTGILMGIIGGLIIGVVLGPFFIRLRGDYFALINAATCAIGYFTIEKVLLPITRGEDGLWYRARMAKLPLLDIRMPWNFFIFTLGVLLIVLLLYSYMDRSVLGISFRAIKVNERKMKFLGYDTFGIRWIGFTLASMLSALAGSLHAINLGFVNPSLAEPARAAEVLVATLIGGSGTVYGPFFGALAFLGINDLVNEYISRWELVVGVMTLLVLFWFSKGIWGSTEAFVSERLGARKRKITADRTPAP